MKESKTYFKESSDSLAVFLRKHSLRYIDFRVPKKACGEWYIDVKSGKFDCVTIAITFGPKSARIIVGPTIEQFVWR